MKKLHSLLPVIVLTLAGVGVSINSVFAQANTVPAGYFTVTAAAGSGTASTTSVLSFPLQGTANITGEAVGIITGVTSNTVTNSNAGWTAGQLSVQTSPYLIQITSGTAAGRTFLLANSTTGTANTATTATLDASETTDLTTLGISVGTDTYKILPADTLSSTFGSGTTTGLAADGVTPVVQGGAASSAADTVVLNTGSSWLTYFFNTTAGAWARAGAPPNNANSVVIRPDTGVLYNRLASTALTITVLGQAPSVARQAAISNQNVTFLSAYFPTNVSLLSSNIQNIPGWVSGASVGASDTVTINAGSWKQYFFNGSHWYTIGPPISMDTTTIPAGSTVIITRKNASSGSATLSEPLPYSLN
jgi:hypothetical protein